MPVRCAAHRLKWRQAEPKSSNRARSIKQLKAAEQELEEVIAPLRDLYDQCRNSLDLSTPDTSQQ